MFICHQEKDPEEESDDDEEIDVSSSDDEGTSAPVSRKRKKPQEAGPTDDGLSTHLGRLRIQDQLITVSVFSNTKSHLKILSSSSVYQVVVPYN